MAMTYRSEGFCSGRIHYWLSLITRNLNDFDLCVTEYKFGAFRPQIVESCMNTRHPSISHKPDRRDGYRTRKTKCTAYSHISPADAAMTLNRFSSIVELF